MLRRLDREWTAHWINNLISIETVRANDFSTWMWCPERYDDVDLDYMAGLWSKRRLGDYHGGLIPDSMLGIKGA